MSSLAFLYRSVRGRAYQRPCRGHVGQMRHTVAPARQLGTARWSWYAPPWPAAAEQPVGAQKAEAGPRASLAVFDNRGERCVAGLLQLNGQRLVNQGKTLKVDADKLEELTAGAPV